MLREMSDREKQILHDITYMQNLNKKKRWRLSKIGERGTKEEQKLPVIKNDFQL